ncbi:MAG: TonB-dependent receptor [Gammaproteobacteria bacterium]|jgi:outer membrane receptor protein involved in Fe transport|nr:TonB-dependent receptor [Gammaproteobacteria bacterium]
MNRVNKKFVALMALILFSAQGILAQEDASQQVEEITVTGSQIKGAKISGALPVSVIRIEDIEGLGVDSGEELLENIAENGMNLFNESENASGGVNSARGDMGAYNLRNMGTGNTLTLLNGRRLVNSPGYQTELIGGDYVPAMTVNSNLVPVWGIDRMEILRDGASAIYGADAVAGVVNNVLQKDYEGFQFRTKFGWFDNFDAEDKTFTGKFGKNFNDGATNVSVFFDHYDREPINAQEDPRWGNSDHRQWTTCDLADGTDPEGRCLPKGSPWANSSSFRNTSANNFYGQFDMVSSSEHGSSNAYNHVFTDSNGEFEVFPLGDSRCSNRSSQGGEVFDTGYGTCIAQDGNGTERYNLWGLTDARSDLQRSNVFVYINHDLGNGIESFTEASFYTSDYKITRHPSAPFSSVKHRVGPDNYWLNQMKLADGTALFAGKQLYVDNYRFAEKMRRVEVEKKTYRLLQGFRGSFDEWDWEGAFLTSKATTDDITKDRISNSLLKEALMDSTPAAYNPFSAGVDSNIERTLIDVYRIGESELTMLDFKVANNEVMELPAGPLGMMFGFEYRHETVLDDRDPRLDGTINYIDYESDTYPEVSDVVNSSPTGDVSGKRNAMSLFAEAQLPLAENVNAQFAMRYEDLSDVDRALVGKIAIGWEITDGILFRASASTAFRAPNIIQINEKIVVRSGTRNDYAMYRVEQLNGLDKDDLNSRLSMQRQATGANNLVSEESENTSIGFVFSPPQVDDLTITADYWSIEKENTIGLFGRDNHTVEDMSLRFANGTNNCDSFVGNPAVVRDAPDPDEAAYFAAAGVCAFGNVKHVEDNYLNLATRTIEGFDVGVYYNVDTGFGDIGIRYIGSFIDKFEQIPGGAFQALAQQQAAGQIPADIPLSGFGDLLLKDGNYDNKHSLRVSWRKGPYGATLTALRKGEFYQNSLTLSDGTRFMIDSMTTMDMNLSYRFDISDYNSRLTLAVKNLADERAPLADRYYGYFADAHQDLGRNYYLDFRVSF